MRVYYKVSNSHSFNLLALKTYFNASAVELISSFFSLKNLYFSFQVNNKILFHVLLLGHLVNIIRLYLRASTIYAIGMRIVLTENMGADNRTNALRTDLSTYRMVFGPINGF